MEKLKVFISGTQDDLQPERKAVAEVIHALGHEPLMAETYGAQPIPSLSAIREMIEQADIYIGVYGARYGWKMDSGVSVTEFEFNEFRRKHPDRILIYIKEIRTDLQQDVFLRRVQDLKEGYFRRPKFTTTEQLASWVKEDLAQFIARVVHVKIRGTPEPALIRAYLEQIASQKPYALWSDDTYIERTVVKADGLFHTAVRYKSETSRVRDELGVPPEIYDELDRRFGLRESFDDAIGGPLAKQAEHEPLVDGLIRERKLVLLGEPGMGKTTSLLRLALEAARRSLAEEGDREIPVYIELKYYNGEELETLFARRMNDILRARNLMLAPNSQESTELLKRWLSKSDAHFLLLLDGLNEVRTEYHTAVRGAIDALFKLPHHVVVSCRERDYDESLKEQAATFVLQGLRVDEIRAYLKSSLEDTGSELFEEQFVSYIQHDEDSLVSQVVYEEEMVTLATNPFMLWLICEVAKVHPEARLPKNRGKLFRQFVTLMPRLRMKDGIRPEIAFDVVETALAKLAFMMQEHWKLGVDLSEVRAWRIPTAGNDLEDVLTQAKDWRLLKSDGRSGEPLEFLHQLFLEYFVAVELRSKIKREGLDATLDQSFVWDGIIEMLAGISQDSGKVIKWLADTAIALRDPNLATTANRCMQSSDSIMNSVVKKAVSDALIFALNHSKGDEYDLAKFRAHCVFWLGRIRDEHAIKPLIRRLKDGYEFVRESALEALLEFGVVAREELIKALTNSHTNIRVGAVYILGEMREPRTAELLIPCLRDRIETVRIVAAAFLSENIDQRAVEPLISALDDPCAEVRAAAAVALGNIGETRPVEALIEMLRDPSVIVRGAATYALGKIGDPHAIKPLIYSIDAPELADEFEYDNDRAQALFRIGPPAISALIDAFHYWRPYVGERAIDILVMIGPPTIEPLLLAIRNLEAATVVGSARTLTKICNIVRNILIDHIQYIELNEADMTENSGRWILFNILFTRLPFLGVYDMEKYDQPLEIPLADEEGVSEALERLIDGNAIQVLAYAQNKVAGLAKELVSSTLDRVTSLLIDALIKNIFDYDYAIQAWLCLLKHPQPSIREHAVRGLGKIGNLRALPELERVIHEDEGKVVLGMFEFNVADSAREATKKIRQRMKSE